MNMNTNMIFFVIRRNKRRNTLTPTYDRRRLNFLNKTTPTFQVGKVPNLIPSIIIATETGVTPLFVRMINLENYSKQSRRMQFIE